MAKPNTNISIWELVSGIEIDSPIGRVGALVDMFTPLGNQHFLFEHTNGQCHEITLFKDT